MPLIIPSHCRFCSPKFRSPNSVRLAGHLRRPA